MSLTKSSLGAKCAHLASICPALQHALARSGLPPLHRRGRNFTTLVQIICEQSVSLASARAVFARIRPGVLNITPAAIRATPALQLRAAGLTRSKVRAVQELATALLTGELDLASLSRRSDQDVIRTLSSLHGIGPWTAEVYLLFALQRDDIWPSADVALLTSIQRLLNLNERPRPIPVALLRLAGNLIEASPRAYSGTTI